MCVFFEMTKQNTKGPSQRKELGHSDYHIANPRCNLSLGNTTVCITGSGLHRTLEERERQHERERARERINKKW